MKIVTSSKIDMDICYEEFREHDGILVFPGCGDDSLNLDLAREATSYYNITIIGTVPYVGFNLVYMLREDNNKEIVSVFQKLYETDKFSDKKRKRTRKAVASLNKKINQEIFNIPSDKKNLKVIIRECSDIAYLPTPRGNEKVDFLISCGDTDQTMNLEGVIRTHRDHLRSDTLFIQAVHNNPVVSGVYSLSGENLAELKDNYRVYIL
ncbi:hypothetical protein GOV08_00325 [Candidatus Woesearchaeota archaeon]|nr:hypothetical protein [Candidatus Woesearchaeota archaeon]